MREVQGESGTRQAEDRRCRAGLSSGSILFLSIFVGSQVFLISPSTASTTNIDADLRKRTIDAIAVAVESGYVFEDQGREIHDLLYRRLDEGA